MFFDKVYQGASPEDERPTRRSIPSGTRLNKLSEASRAKVGQGTRIHRICYKTHSKHQNINTGICTSFWYEEFDCVEEFWAIYIWSGFRIREFSSKEIWYFLTYFERPTVERIIGLRVGPYLEFFFLAPVFQKKFLAPMPVSHPRIRLIAKMRKGLSLKDKGTSENKIRQNPQPADITSYVISGQAYWEGRRQTRRERGHGGKCSE